MSDKRCQVCGARTSDGVVLSSIEEWFPLCSPLCRFAFAEGAAKYLGAALLELSAEIAGVAQQETLRVA